MVRFTLIGVPSSAGTHWVGLEKAPLQLRRAGLVDRLLDAGLDVVDDGDLPLALYRPRSPDRTQQNLDQVVTVAGRVADRVAHTVATGASRWCLAGTARSPWGWSPGAAAPPFAWCAVLRRRRRPEHPGHHPVRHPGRDGGGASAR